MEVRTLRETPRGPRGLPWVSFRTWRVSTASAERMYLEERRTSPGGAIFEAWASASAHSGLKAWTSFDQCCSLWLKRYLRNPPRALLRIKESEHPFLLKPLPCVGASFAATSSPKARVMAARLL